MRSALFEGTDQDRVYIGLVEADPHARYIEATKVTEAVSRAYVSIAEADQVQTSRDKRVSGARRGLAIGF